MVLMSRVFFLSLIVWDYIRIRDIWAVFGVQFTSKKKNTSAMSLPYNAVEVSSDTK